MHDVFRPKAEKSFPADGLIQGKVFLGRFCPGIVSFHTDLLHPVDSMFEVGIAGTSEGIGASIVIVVIEGEAVGDVTLGNIEDGVIEAADVGNDRKGSIAHGNHLAGSAWFEIGRHEEEVACGIQKMGKVLIISLDEIDVLILQGLSQEFIFHLTGSDDDHLGILLFQVRHDGHQAFDTLLGRKAGDGREERAIKVDIHAEFGIECALVCHLSFLDAGKIIVPEKELIRGRIPDVDVQSVDDTAEVIVPAPVDDGTHASETSVVMKEFLGVCLADGVDLVSRHDAGLQEVEGIAKADETGIIISQGQVEVGGKVFPSSPSLIGRIVDGQDRLDGLRIEGEQKRKDGRLPIVAVDDIKIIVTGDEGVDGHDKAGKAFVVITISIHLVPVEPVHGKEVEIDSVLLKKEGSASLGSPAHLEVKLIIEAFHDFRELGPHGKVERHDDRDILAEFAEGLAIGIDKIS